MPDIININAKEANEKLILINKYFMLIIVICFGTAIVFLYIQMQDLNKRMLEYMNSDVKENAKTIQHNTTIIQENTNTLEKLNKVIDEHLKPYSK